MTLSSKAKFANSFLNLIVKESDSPAPKPEAVPTVPPIIAPAAAP